MAEVVADGNSGEWCDGRTLGSDGGEGQEAGIWASVEMRGTGMGMAGVVMLGE